MNDDTQGHAETIREALQWCENSTYAEVQRQRGLAALEALLAERQELLTELRNWRGDDA